MKGDDCGGVYRWITDKYKASQTSSAIKKIYMHMFVLASKTFAIKQSFVKELLCPHTPIVIQYNVSFQR